MSSRRNFIYKGSLALGALSLPHLSFAGWSGGERALIKPPALKVGDTVAISSPAGAVWDDAQVETFTNILESFGFNVIPGKTLKEKFGYFAGSDELRAEEINSLFADKDVKGIFCMKGGWGCARILDKLDYEGIRKNPKVLIGFSDITALLLAITHRSGLLTFHGPVGNSGWNDFTKEAFTSVVMKTKPYAFPPNPFSEEKIQVINSGQISGALAGGNLTVLSALIGSSYLPDWKGKILFLEEAKEEPYSIDRMLTQLKLSGVLDQVAGFVFGKCAKCLAEEPEKAFTFNEILLQHIKPLKIPAISGAMIGHIENKLTVPLGIRARLDATTASLALEESAVV
jgi:muramoyltetrapeptide carboxypeptidase